MTRRRRWKIALLVLLVAAVALCGGCASATDGNVTSNIGDSVLAQLTGGRSEAVDIVVLLTVLSLLPSILIMLTGFTRIIIVLSLIRNGLGMQNMPPNQVLIGLALFLTFFVMSPVITQIEQTAYEPYIAGQINDEEAIDKAMVPLRDFMLRQTYKSDLNYFISASPTDQGIQNVEEISNTTLIPAFITSEIKRGFQIGFFIYIPFIVIDMVVASTLMSMGMMMLPPTVISLPFKILLFVLVDGWTLTVQTLITSFG